MKNKLTIILILVIFFCIYFWSCLLRRLRKSNYNTQKVEEVKLIKVEKDSLVFQRFDKSVYKKEKISNE